MARTLTTTLRNAVDQAGTYYQIVRVDAWRSRIFFSAITNNNAVSGADAVGIVDTPMPQDIEFNAAAGLVTFYSSGGNLAYALQGDSTPVATSYACTCKPGVVGSSIYLYSGSAVVRYAINWSSIAAKSATPLSSEASAAMTLTVHAVHGISSTEAIAFAEDEGGFRPLYISGTSSYPAPGRFMFPKFVDWDGSARTMASLGVFSCGMKLNTQAFAYISNASSGMVEGMFYDTDTGQWSDSFIALPTELETSKCEFRIANGYSRNGTMYMCGQFSRTDAYTNSQPYSLVLSSTNGKYFSIDRFSIVSALGYRFLARAGSDNNFYLGNCNRVCEEEITWVFDGVTGTGGDTTAIPGSRIVSVRDTNITNMVLELSAGDEVYTTDPNLEEGARIQLYVGMKTTAGDEYILYGTYIIDAIDEVYSDGNRTISFNCMNESLWKLTGLNMPFYAEIYGKSTIYEPMLKASGNLSAAGNASVARTYFDIDFWQHEPYTNTGASITGISMMDGGGVRWKDYTTAFKYGIITKSEVKHILGLKRNPIITGTSLTVNLHGWARTYATGQANPYIELVLILSDEKGENEETYISNEDSQWKQTYYDNVSDEEPIVITVDATTYVGKYIKKVGIVFEQIQTYGGVFNIARVEFTNNVEVPIGSYDESLNWEVVGDGSWKLPKPGRPYIMYSTRPYNAYNFSLMARFTNTITGNITGYSVGPGLVGHGEDGSNYTVARYNDTANLAELLLVRNGKATVLASAAPGWTVGTDQRLLFTHKDGVFKLSMYRTSTTQFEQVLSYAWEAADGFMYTSRTTVMKSGIYGFIGVPWFRTLGLWTGNSDDTTNAEGIGVNPLDSITDFPTPTPPATYKFRLEDNIYSYAGKIAKPTLVRGPYQFRQMDTYIDPYGDGTGLEVYDFDWLASTTALNGYLIAVDSGASFVCSGALWQIFITTDGNPVWLYGRARYYSDNAQIARIFHMLHNRVWVTGGLEGISLVDGQSMKHSAGAIAYLELEGEITCSYFMAAGGPDCTSLNDLITAICTYAGARAVFSGDIATASMAIGTGTLIQRDNYADGFELQWETATPLSFSISANVKIGPDNYEEKDLIDEDTGITISVDSLGSGSYRFTLTSTPSDTDMYTLLFTGGTSVQKYRLAFHEKNISLYQNGQWVATVALDALVYDQTTYIDVTGSGSITFNDVLYRELPDWREAVYIDLETDGQSAISSVIQERPVEIHALPDGSLDFWYNKTGAEITGVVQARSIRRHRQIPKEGSSDAIVNAYDDVFTLQHSGFAATMGFASRLMRLPNMQAGAVEAAQILLNRLYEGRIKTILTIRPELAALIGDTYTYSYTLSGTGKVIAGTLYIEGHSLSIASAGRGVESQMTIEGRENE